MIITHCILFSLLIKQDWNDFQSLKAAVTDAVAYVVAYVVASAVAYVVAFAVAYAVA